MNTEIGELMKLVFLRNNLKKKTFFKSEEKVISSLYEVKKISTFLNNL